MFRPVGKPTPVFHRHPERHGIQTQQPAPQSSQGPHLPAGSNIPLLLHITHLSETVFLQNLSRSRHQLEGGGKYGGMIAPWTGGSL